MNKNEFGLLFSRKLNEAILFAENLTRLTATQIVIELHGAGFGGKLMSLDEAEKLMFIDEKTSYQIIDIGVKAWVKGQWQVFVRISDHPPSSFEKTWNTPLGSGPFKVFEPYRIEIQND